MIQYIDPQMAIANVALATGIENASALRQVASAITGAAQSRSEAAFKKRMQTDLKNQEILRLIEETCKSEVRRLLLPYQEQLTIGFQALRDRVRHLEKQIEATNHGVDDE